MSGRDHPRAADQAEELAAVDHLLGEARDHIRSLARASSTQSALSLSLRQVLDHRRRRAEFFGPGLFADPTWDVLLELTVSHLEGKKVPVTSACIAASVPPTTALRWINLLVEQGLVTREPDPKDRRRVYLQLSNSGKERMSAYLQAAGIVAEI